MPAAEPLELQLGAVELGQADQEPHERALLGGRTGVCLCFGIHTVNPGPRHWTQRVAHTAA